jgi:hypothetical protein
VGTAQSLGITTLNQQVGNDPSQTLARRIITQRQLGFNIGTYANSTVQMARAYAHDRQRRHVLPARPGAVDQG